MPIRLAVLTCGTIATDGHLFRPRGTRPPPRPRRRRRAVANALHPAMTVVADPAVTGEDGRAALALVDAAYRSAVDARRVAVDHR